VAQVDVMSGNIALYQVLKGLGVPDDAAARAVETMPAREEFELLATKAEMQTEFAAVRADLALLRMEVRADIADMKGELIKTVVGLMVALTAIYASLLGVLAFFLKR
jgi:hypothetical protein